MRITRGFIFGSIVTFSAGFWLLAWWSPIDARNMVSVSYAVLSVVTAFILLTDVIDLIKTNGEGISWQAGLGKLGIFLLTAAFAFGSGWAALISLQGFPPDLIKSPIGTYFRFLQGIGLGALYWGLSDPDSVTPRLNTSLATTLMVLASGIVIGYALGHIPLLSISD